MAPTERGYQLLDSGFFRKLERVGPYLIVRPAAQAVWKPKLEKSVWQKADAEFFRQKQGEGEWQVRNKRLPAQWEIPIHNLKMLVKLTEFGHLGIFPEHHESTPLRTVISQYRSQNKEFRLLNLFAYTGALSLLSASWGAQTVHLDASKTSVAWARQNAEVSDMAQLPIRWITDDVQKFVQREQRRGVKYQGVVLDPPSYGRGPKGEVWKIEDHLLDLLQHISGLFAADFCYAQLSAHSAGYTPLVLENLLKDICPVKKGQFHSFEMFVKEEGGRPLPSGACSIYARMSDP